MDPLFFVKKATTGDSHDIPLGCGSDYVSVGFFSANATLRLYFRVS